MATADQPDRAARGSVAKRSSRRRDPRALPPAGDLGGERARRRAAGPRRRAPRAGARQRPPARRHHAAQALADPERDPRGRRVLRPRRPGAPEVARAALRRPARRLRDELPQVRDGGAGARRRSGSRASSTSCSPSCSSRWATRPSPSSTRWSFPLSRELDATRAGELQSFTPTIEALVTPDIDASLDEQDAKTRFWNAFKALGTWWAELPPY